MNLTPTGLRRVATSLTLVAASGLCQAATESSSNNFFGTAAGFNVPTGNQNSFFGANAGHETTTGSSNVFVGFSAGYMTSSGTFNTCAGKGAGGSTSTGSGNTFLGNSAGADNTIGSQNTALGFNADVAANNLTNATAIGALSEVSQSNSLVLGSVNGVNTATSNVNVGIGTTAPARQLHVIGDNAVFRMDRTTDAAAFMLVRIDNAGNPLKTFVVGASAAGPHNGTFVINDLDTAVGGGGHNRMTIYNDGSVHFPGIVTTGSSIRFKHDVSTLTGADLALNQLRGVRFTRNDNGKPDIGLIAEEVAQVYPELVGHHPETGEVKAVNYQAFVGVLIEGFKAQQATVNAQQAKLETQQQELSQVRAENQVQQAKLETQQQELAQLRADQNQQLAALREQLALLEVRLALSQGTAPSVSSVFPRTREH